MLNTARLCLHPCCRWMFSAFLPQQCPRSEADTVTEDTTPLLLPSAPLKSCVQPQWYYRSAEMDFVAVLPLAKAAHRLTLSSSSTIPVLPPTCHLLHLWTLFLIPLLISPTNSSQQNKWSAFFILLHCVYVVLLTFRKILKGTVNGWMEYLCSSGAKIEANGTLVLMRNALNAVLQAIL